MAVGLWGCMCCLIVEAALTAEFVPSHNTAALSAAVAMFFVFQIFDTAMLNGMIWMFQTGLDDTDGLQHRNGRSWEKSSPRTSAQRECAYRFRWCR